MLELKKEYKEKLEKTRKERLINTIGNLIDYVKYTIDKDLEKEIDKFLSDKGVDSFSDLDYREKEEFLYILVDILKNYRKISESSR